MDDSTLITIVSIVGTAASVGLLVVAVPTAIFAWRRFRRETLDITVNARYGALSGPGYSELGFQVCLINKGTEDVIVYSAGYHVKDDKDDRNFHFFDDYIYHRPAEEGDDRAFPNKRISRPSEYDSYRPDSPYATIHSKIMFPIRIPSGGIYTGRWPVTVKRHRNHLNSIENQMYNDYFGLWPIVDNPIPYIFFSTIYGTQKIAYRPFGRFPKLTRLCRLATYRVSQVIPFDKVREFIFQTDYGIHMSYWSWKLAKAAENEREYFFPPHSFATGIYPMSVEENEQKKNLQNTIRHPKFSQVQNHVNDIAKGDGHIKTANYSFDVSTTHGFHNARPSLLKATVERPEGYTSWNVHSFLELNMLLGLKDSWAYSETNTIRRQMPDGKIKIYDTRYYLIPHENELP